MAAFLDPGTVVQVRRVLAVDHRLRVAGRMLAARLWTPGHAELVAEHLGHARWELLARDDLGVDRPPDEPPDPVDEWEQVRRAGQSAELARLLTRFAVRNGVPGAPTRPTRLVLLDDAHRLGDPLRHRPLARARRELLACPVAAFGSRPHPWMVFAAPATTPVPAWDVEGRQLLTDLGILTGTGDRALWRTFAALLAQGVPARPAFGAARTGAAEPGAS